MAINKLDTDYNDNNDDDINIIRNYTNILKILMKVNFNRMTVIITKFTIKLY